MSYIREMYETHPVNPRSDDRTAQECITACYACAEACNVCADACLGEGGDMKSCIRKNLDCADICLATARVVSRLTATDKNLVGALLRACARACRICGIECESHGEKYPHCSVCSQACLRCASACENLLAEPA